MKKSFFFINFPIRSVSFAHWLSVDRIYNSLLPGLSSKAKYTFSPLCYLYITYPHGGTTRCRC